MLQANLQHIYATAQVLVGSGPEQKSQVSPNITSLMPKQYNIIFSINQTSTRNTQSEK
jgi:hypothetical protein